jgi:phosphatidylserine/phosphatidylglycerophosphate/cardiolipin synthase-like enzyme
VPARRNDIVRATSGPGDGRLARGNDMRFKSDKVDGYQIFAVSGTNVISFGIDATGANKKGLLGFAVERHDPKENQRYFMYGFKVFPSVIPKPTSAQSVSTFDHPIQSFVWDDFTAKEDREYEYIFHPLKGKPKNIDRSARPISITVHTEPQFSDNAHDVFFNRGVASSQAYVRRFGNKKPNDLPADKKKEALHWLSRELETALLKFIADAKKGDTLLCCFYEFRYRPVAEALKDAMSKKRGVNVRIIVDCKENSQSFPRNDNLKLIKDVGIPIKNVVFKRAARASSIQHNKFMVLLKGAAQKPSEVWTGSTNISDGGIFGQTNVGHWVRDEAVAERFQAYWEILSKDPGAKKGEDRTKANAKNKKFRESVEALLDVPVKQDDIESGITPVFSPRSADAVLKMYATMNDEAKRLSCITLAFGINKEFKDLLKNNAAADHLAFLLLEKEDKPNPKAKDPFVNLTAKNNVYKAWGAFIDDPVYQWARETNTKFLKLNNHVAYIHSKFLLVDPLSDDPIVVSGSANFSTASTKENDENMIIVRGDKRTADIYFSEFNRLFFHYYFRSVHEKTKDQDADATKAALFLSEDDSWLASYKPGLLKQKRVEIFSRMTGFTDG